MAKFDAWNEAEQPDEKYRRLKDHYWLAVGTGVVAVLVMFVALVGVIALMVAR